MQLAGVSLITYLHRTGQTLRSKKVIKGVRVESFMTYLVHIYYLHALLHNLNINHIIGLYCTPQLWKYEIP